MHNVKNKSEKFEVKKVGCIGAGYVGGLSISVFAEKTPGIKFYVYDINKKKIDQWNSKHLPIYEPGLDRIVEKCRDKNLFFTCEFKDLLDCEVIFFSVSTPTKVSGIGKGKAANLEYIEKCARAVRKAFFELEKEIIIVEKSTVPIRTAECIQTILGEKGGKTKFHVLSNPEFLAEGTAVNDLYHPSRILIGGENQKAVNTLSWLYEHWIKPEKIITTNVWSSELSKLVSNTFLAQRISSINAISALCEKTGARAMEVSKVVGLDDRIGKKFLNPSVGFGGSCFQKDILNLCYLCDFYGLHEVSKYFEGIIEINKFQRKRFAKKVVDSLFSTVSNKKLTIFGFAFKKNTGDTRESSSLYISKYFLKERAKLNIYDPKVKKEDIFSDLSNIMNGGYHYDPIEIYTDSKKTDNLIKNNVEVFNDPYEACKDSHAILVLTEWDEFKKYDYKKIFDSMEKPAWIFDGRIILDENELKKIGFKVYQIGSPSSN